MITFQFTINDSFKTDLSHPITVPKSQVNYAKLKESELDKGNFTIIFPKGERAHCHMYSGVAGYGPYYQIRFHSGEAVPQYFNEGDKVIILLFRDAETKYVAIEYRE